MLCALVTVCATEFSDDRPFHEFQNLNLFETILASTQSTTPTVPDKRNAEPNSVRKFLSVFQYSQLAMKIVWSTSAPLTLAMAAGTLLSGVLPAVIASVGGMFVDACRRQSSRPVMQPISPQAGAVLCVAGSRPRYHHDRCAKT